MRTFVASIDAEPKPLSRDFATAKEAVAWAREHAHGRAWGVGELTPDGPPRIVATGLPADRS